jgi:iron(III) transport system ATP-binding protein
LAIADRIVLLAGGQVEQEGAPSDVYGEPRSLAAAELIGYNNRFDGTLASNDGRRAVIEVAGVRVEGVARSSASAGEAATAIIRMERTLVGGGPGPNRVPMTLAAQRFLGERWELTFVKDALTVRAFVSAPLKHEFYHVELPADAVWIF